ncbi:MAG: PH domain-containing protein [Candidatus Methanoplasma sp.]|jgi:hypothetical protein|nr:PH domain-containing protein [Candidatus Methanoplasma sp.]
MDNAYKPKIDGVFWSHAGVLIIVLAMVLAFMIYVQADTLLIVLLFSILLLASAYIVLIVKRTKYVLNDCGIIVQNAIIKHDIPYTEVKKITNTDRNLINYGVFVLSLDRVGIEFGKIGHTLVSPADKQGFLTDLRSRCINADYEEDLRSKKK